MEPELLINQYTADIISNCQVIDHQAIMDIYKALLNTNKAKGKIFICGNGGSASTASHFQSDLNKAFSISRGTSPVFCLNDNIAVLTSLSNDNSYDDVFLNQLKYVLNEHDTLITISGSGNSTNVVKAAEFAKRKGNTVIAFVGFDGGKLKKISDYSLHVNINNMQISEDMHLICCHLISTMIREDKKIDD